MKKILAKNLIGPALDWAAAIAYGWTDVQITGYEDPSEPDEPFFRPAKIIDGVEVCGSGDRWRPSSSWSQGGPIIEREWSNICAQQVKWAIQNIDPGKNLLVSWMRCFVASRLGDEIEIPEELQ